MATTVPAPRTSVPPEGSTRRKVPDEWKEALGQAVHRLVSLGARVESQGDYQAILVTGHRLNHVLRLATFGFWGGEHRTLVSVDGSGHTTIQKLSR